MFAAVVSRLVMECHDSRCTIIYVTGGARQDSEHHPPPINHSSQAKTVRDLQEAPIEDNKSRQSRFQRLFNISLLKEKIFAKCDSVEQVIQDVKANRLVDKSPFSWILVQSHPEFAAIAWGAPRLALQYDEVVIQLKGKEMPTRFKQSIASIYTDMLRSFRSVLHVFINKDGTPKGRHLILANIVWKPYDVRFKDLLDDMGYHSEIVKVELQLATYQELQELQATLTTMQEDMARRQEKWSGSQHREEVVRHLQHWIDPPPFAIDYEQAINI
ncbi:hypothetical protein K469DRAFT_685867 [Zopfia rhizophila CBS 207.26]|uniref:Uncharacterized protein n=1 Tax=Zopfia rhizophila CBS 207.26 TaxID=1314779 RepID=A0A6A6E8A2_9PEZI|nr:hypothetical protein K469DRAFT_685867 [Zopfia rhizophila CBS 207.26]